MGKQKKVRMPKGYRKGVITRGRKNYSTKDWDEYDYWVQGIGKSEA